MTKVLALVTLALGLCIGMQAETMDPVGGSSHGFSGSGTLYATENGTGDGSYTITGIDGTGVTGLIDPGGFHGNSNQLFPGASPSLDSTGFSFTDTMGNTNFQVNVFADTDGTYGIHVLDSDGISIDDTVTFTLGTPAANSTMRSYLRQRNFSNSGVQAFTFSFDTAPADATTPEPSSIALLGTGLLGVAGVVRKRRA